MHNNRLGEYMSGIVSSHAITLKFIEIGEAHMAAWRRDFRGGENDAAVDDAECDERSLATPNCSMMVRESNCKVNSLEKKPTMKSAQPTQAPHPTDSAREALARRWSGLTNQIQTHAVRRYCAIHGRMEQTILSLTQ